MYYIHKMVGADVSTLISVALVAAASGCLVRLAFLKLFSVYPAFVFFLFFQIAITVISNVANVSTGQYAWAFVPLLTLEWLAYALMIRELYRSIFSRYPGIAILGQWSLYGAGLAALAVFALGVATVKLKVSQLGTGIPAAEFVSHCVLFGYAAFIIILIIAVSRYPLGLHRNVILNCVLFGFLLLAEAAGLIANQATSRHFTANLNLAVNALGALCLSAWGMLLVPQEKINIDPVRPAYSVVDEERLLHQLSTVNALLLRGAKK